MTTDTPLREARLKPEYAELYPGVEPGVWYTAATLAGHLLSRFLRQERAARSLPERILDDHHFEFRGEGGLKGGRIPLGG
jgi:hypothetical protein